MSERVDVQQLRDLIKARALIGIPGGFTEGVTECLPADDDDWGYVLSESEFAVLLARLDALERTDATMFRDFVEWTANLTDEQLGNGGYDWWAHRANARSLLDVAEGGRLYAVEETTATE